MSVLTYQVEASAWDVAEWNAHQIGCNAVTWCPSARPDSLLHAVATGSNEPVSVFAPMRIASGGCDNLVKVWKYAWAVSILFSCRHDGKEWKLESELNGHSDWVRDVTWAPNIGVPMHTLVSCSQDRTVLIWKSVNAEPNTWSKQLLTPEPFPDSLWRLNFSPGGNLLAVAGGDNHISMWRECLDGKWECVSNVDQASLAQSNK